MNENRRKTRRRQLEIKKSKVPRAERSLVCLIQALEGRKVVVELQNDVIIRGMLDEVDEYMNLVMSSVTMQSVQGGSNVYDVLYVRGRTVRFVHLPKALDVAQAVEAQRQKLVEMRMSEFKARQSLARLGKGSVAGEHADEGLEEGLWDEEGQWALGGIGGAEEQEQHFKQEEAFACVGQGAGADDWLVGGQDVQQAQAGPRVIPHRNHSRHRKKPWPAPDKGDTAGANDPAHLQMRQLTGQLQAALAAPAHPQEDTIGAGPVSHGTAVHHSLHKVMGGGTELVSHSKASDFEFEF